MYPGIGEPKIWLELADIAGTPRLFSSRQELLEQLQLQYIYICVCVYVYIYILYVCVGTCRDRMILPGALCSRTVEINCYHFDV